MAVISVAERNDVPFVDVAGTLGVAVAGIGRAGRSSTGIGTWFQGTYGAILLNSDGSYTYRLDTLDPDTNVLAAGQTGEERFSYTYVENGAVKTGSLIVRIGGIDEADQQLTNSASTIEIVADSVLAASQRIVSSAQLGVRVLGTQSNHTDFDIRGSISAGSSTTNYVTGLGSFLNDFGLTTNHGRIEAVAGLEGIGATGVIHNLDFVNYGVVGAYSTTVQTGDGGAYLRRAVGMEAAERFHNAGTIEAISLHGEAFGVWTGVHHAHSTARPSECGPESTTPTWSTAASSTSPEPLRRSPG